MNYEIKGGNLPVVCCQLAKGESVQCEAGAMAWMDPGIEMSTHGNGLGKIVSTCWHMHSDRNFASGNVPRLDMSALSVR